MPQHLVPVKLHRERFSQLQFLANRNGTSPAGAIEQLLSAAVERGELPDTFHGIAIARDANVVVVTVDCATSLRLTLPDARGLADHIEGFAARTVAGSSATFASAAGDAITITRVGMAFGIVSDPARLVISAGMIHDIARQLRGAAS